MAFRSRQGASRRKPVRRNRSGAHRSSGVRRRAAKRAPARRRRSGGSVSGHRTLRIVVEAAPANTAARPETAVASDRKIRKAKF